MILVIFACMTSVFETQMKSSILDKLILSQTHYGQEARLL